MKTDAVLLVAYQCGPGMGSVSQIGWEWYARLAARQPVTLVTHVRNRTALEASGAPLPGSDIHYVDTEWFAGPLYRLAKRLFPRSEHSVFLLSSLDYFVFDWCAYRSLRREQAAGRRWSILHRVTPVTLAAPTWLGRLGLPTIIGPLNSGLSDPTGFDQVMRQESTWLVRLRALTRAFDGLIGSTRRSAFLLVANSTTRHGIATRFRRRCRPMLENGVDLQQFRASPWPAAPGAQHALQVLFVGRLIPVKALDLLLDAIARLTQIGHAVELTVIGDGPMRADWEALSRCLGLTAQVCFLGAQDAPRVAAAMAASHVFCLPSVRESGGAVLLEAMASARPVIAMDYGGPSEIVDGNVGALIPVTNPRQAGGDLARQLLDVIRHPALWAQKGREGRERVEARYSWNAKVTRAQHLYAEARLAGEGKPQWN